MMTTASEGRPQSKFSTLSIVYSGMFAALMMIGANITSFIPFLVVGGVPITLQTFFAVLSGLLLGSRLGALSMTVYMMVGLAGAPVFAKFQGGFGQILSPTFGFIVTFILIAYVAGKIVERKNTLPSYIIASLVATAINYLLGTNWMYVAYKVWAAAPEVFTYKIAWLWMIPPLPKDIVLAVLAGIFAFRISKHLKVRHTF
ncbi:MULTISPECIES: biotin transporter BioY [Sporosarcina]|uniref:Biotin transporter n=2 Tax=Sporosarcina newyorkensis TaxID=759851 RepID=F9DUC4_9BACL|nr:MULTISPECIES: biotin transporter BioY [Sporosarcina]EGQ24722.1 biotin synthesis BioY protein [Sporosarcina newyorkensis 2681]MBY0224129.1 BioY family transporter [Sporosarcina aquimarina]